MIRFRADLSADPMATGLELKSLGLPILFSLRSTAEGGNCKRTLPERETLFLEAAAHFDLIELEAAQDLSPTLLSAIPPTQRIISWHGPSLTFEALSEKLAQCCEIPAAYYLLVPKAEKAAEALIPIRLLRTAQQANLVTYAAGSVGQWTRILAPFLGTGLVFADPQRSGSVNPTPSQWQTDYGLPHRRPVEQLFGIGGNPVSRSLSPRLHNAAYRYHGLPYLYLPFHIEDFSAFWAMVTGEAWQQCVGIEIKGITTVSPFKEAAFQAINYTENPYVALTQAGNLALYQQGKWKSDSTDGLGVQTLLSSFNFEPEGKKVALVGCGGAGRAIAAHLSTKGAEVCCFNRSAERGKTTAEMLGIPYAPLASFNPAGYHLIINATPLGKQPTELPVDPALADQDTIFIDLTYRKGDTLMIQKARKLGMRTGSGSEILVHQVTRQFAAMTGKEMPTSLAEEYAGILKVNTI